MRRGDILSLDLATKMGVAIGAPGEPPRAFTVILKNIGEDQSVAFSNLIAWLDGQLRPHTVALCFKEQMLPLAAFKHLDAAAKSVRLQMGLHAIVEGMCGRFGVPCEQRADSTVRKHFCGRGREGTRAESKAAVIARCHQLGLMPNECNDDNRADAIAGHDWASTHLFRTPPTVLHFFPGRRIAS